MTLKHLALAGVLAELVFELYAWFVSPILFGVTLEPARLVMALGEMWMGLSLGYPVAFVIHFVIGALGFASVVYALQRLLAGRYLMAGLASGLLLWFVAQGLLAPLVGRSFMMGFGAYTQSSLIGHVMMTVVLAWVWRRLAEGDTPRPLSPRSDASGDKTPVPRR